MTVDFDLHPKHSLPSVSAFVRRNFTLRVRCGDPMNLARTDQETHGNAHRPSYDIAIVIPHF